MGSKELSKAFGYLSEGELVAMKRVIESLPEGSRCVNIGAGSGTSGIAFMESNKVAELYTVDIFGGDRPEGGLGNERNALKESGFLGDPRYHGVCGDSADVGRAWEGEMLDMVFIDGNHSYEHCKEDILVWIELIKHNGVIALHDYKSVWPGVEKAVDEVLGNYGIIALSDTFIAFRVER